MNQPLLLRTVFWRFGRFKLKTIFMGLGITVGVLATVLLLTALMSIENAFAAYNNRAYPADGLVVMAGGGFTGAPGGRANLHLADMEAVVSSLGVKEWDPIAMIGVREVKHEGHSVPVGVAGVSEKAENVRRRSVQDGEFFNADEVRSRANVALLGSTTARTLFPGESPVGARIFIDNIPFEVKGVLESVGVDPHGGDQDSIIWVPCTTVMEKVLKTSSISGATLMLEDASRDEEIKKEIVDTLRARHQIGEGQQDDFSVITPVFVRQFRARTFRTWTIFARLITGTAFLISAIVILSIMQISIKGRTAEIGLRKAVGARSRDLQTQIVLEVLFVSLAASVAGLVLAYIGSAALTPMLVAKYGVKDAHPSVPVMALAVGLAMATGLLGGLWPARRAAKLEPVRALK